MKIHIRLKVCLVRLQPFHRDAQPFQVFFRCPYGGKSCDLTFIRPPELHKVIQRVLIIGQLNQGVCLAKAVRILHKDFPVSTVFHDAHEAHNGQTFTQRVS